jgi:hypothetical protein
MRLLALFIANKFLYWLRNLYSLIQLVNRLILLNIYSWNRQYNKENTVTTDNIYQTPEAPLLSQDEPTEALQFFTTQRRKLIISGVCTLNIYSIYWFYKHWTAQRINGGRDCIPVLRAIFQVFFVFSLFSTIKYDAEFKKLAVTWSAGWLAAFYILCTIVGSIPMIIGNAVFSKKLDFFNKKIMIEP